MREQLYTLLPMRPDLGAPLHNLPLAGAFTRVMEAAGRDFMFARVGAWTMHMLTPDRVAGDPSFESTLSVDNQARAAIMRQVCDHGLGVYEVIPEEQQQMEADHGRAA